MELVGEAEQAPKKKPKLGRLTEVKRKILKQSHEVGPNCHCTRLKCFDAIDDCTRLSIIRKFNEMHDYNEQNLYLGGLITSSLVKQRRPRKNDPDSHTYAYSYKVRYLEDGSLIETPVCYKAFISIHGITPRRVQTLQSMLTTKGAIVKDGRGCHSNRPEVSQETVDKVHEHIRSLKGRRSHYSRHDSRKIYLSETLDIKKLHNLYSEKYPSNPVSYDSYRTIFNTKYNIGFGYPRTDTCSTCDQYKVREQDLQKQIDRNPSDILTLEKELRKLKSLQELHLRKAESFYEVKRSVRKQAQKSSEIEGICMDFQKNLSTPNISTNDVYYRRQLSYYLFNIHVLSTQDSFFYVYDETVGHKGSDEVSSLLYHFIFNFLKPQVRRLTIFCDSCAGQNKNFTLFRLAYFIVHVCGRLDSLKMVFPVRGHSYMECDRNMGLVNQKSYCEVPDDWITVIANARVKPNPFVVFKCDQSVFLSWTAFFQTLDFKEKCPFPSRPIRELEVTVDKSKMILIRESYNGAFTSVSLVRQSPDAAKPSKRPKKKKEIIFIEMTRGLEARPAELYSEKIPLSKSKFEDLQVLKKFLTKESQLYYESLTSATSRDMNNDANSTEVFGESAVILETPSTNKRKKAKKT